MMTNTPSHGFPLTAPHLFYVPDRPLKKKDTPTIQNLKTTTPLKQFRSMTGLTLGTPNRGQHLKAELGNQSYFKHTETCLHQQMHPSNIAVLDPVAGQVVQLQPTNSLSQCQSLDGLEAPPAETAKSHLTD